MSNTLNYLAIGNRIRFAREIGNKTQSDLGKHLGIDRRVVSAIEKGEPCSRNRYSKIAKFLSLDLDYLLFGENELARNLCAVILKESSELISNPALSVKTIIDKYKSIIDYFEKESKN